MKEFNFKNCRWCKVVLLVLLALLAIVSAKTANAGGCDFPWQFASDGSRCGKRAAIMRPGGIGGSSLCAWDKRFCYE